jgi:hypothetical protein
LANHSNICKLDQDGVFIEVTEAEFLKKSAYPEDLDESKQNF